jgi:hypothetical protein
MALSPAGAFPEKPMSQSEPQKPKAPPLASAAAAAEDFVARLGGRAPRRIEAKVASEDGMPLLCAVEAVLGSALPGPAVQELIWLSGAPRPGAHVLRLQAFGAGGELIGEAEHEFEAQVQAQTQPAK